MKIVGIFLLNLVAFFSLSSELTFAQGISSDGKDFYLGFVYPSYNKNPKISNDQVGGPSGFNVFVKITSYSDNNLVKVSYFDTITHSETTSGQYSLNAHQSIQVPLNWVNLQMSE